MSQASPWLSKATQGFPEQGGGGRAWHLADSPSPYFPHSPHLFLGAACGPSSKSRESCGSGVRGIHPQSPQLWETLSPHQQPYLL